MTTWMPIPEDVDVTKAPFDGGHVLLSCVVDPPGGFVCEGYYEEGYGWYKANTHWTDAYDGSVEPTHWQPLPAAPKPGDAR